MVHQSSKGYLQITLANGTVLKVTEEHPFLTKLAEKALKDNGRFSSYYTPAGKLRPGDTLYQTTPGRRGGPFPAELEPVKIVRIEKKAYRGRVYNLNIAETHTYFADGVAVHNEKSNQNQNNDSGDNEESACVDGKPCSNNSDCPGGHCAWDPIQPNCACGGGRGSRTYHYAYFFLDSNKNGYQDEGEKGLSSRAYVNFFSPCKNTDKNKMVEDTYYYRANTTGTSDKFGFPVPAAGGEAGGVDFLTQNANYYGCGVSVYAVPETHSNSSYYVGGVKFKDYDGSNRPVYSYAKSCWYDEKADEQRCNERYLYYRGVDRTSYKAEKDFYPGARGISSGNKGDIKLQLAEFTVDYSGAYYLTGLHGSKYGARDYGGGVTIYRKEREVKMPVSRIDKQRTEWGSFQIDQGSPPAGG